jgi:cation diffusion facilitator CzcD-associated flavoprotein CzcO
MSATPDSERIEDLRHKYADERAKRIRSDGNAQYIKLSGQFSTYLEDPYVEPGFERLPLADEVDVVMVGGGFAGLLAAGYLKKAGVESVRIIEKGGDFGGTWYWNRYPGVACDVESYIYMPLLEEMGYVPSQKYARGDEIRGYCSDLARHFNLYDAACFQTQVTDVSWDDASKRWIVRTDRGDEIRARFVGLGSGPLNMPKLPGIPGIESFVGRSFHTSRWDFDYTGGDSRGGLTELRNKRVAVIGTGATAVQCVPHLGEWAEHLYVFQRTPAIVGERNNKDTDADWFKGLEPGWQRRRMRNFDGILSGLAEVDDLVGDEWTNLWKPFIPSRLDGAPPPDAAEQVRAVDIQKMEEIRARVDHIVSDPDTAEALKPYYYRFCKRPCFHDDYLKSFNRPNVTLVDTRGKGVERITENAVVVDGKEHPVDCIIFATGFEPRLPTYASGAFSLNGRDGLPMSQKWQDGVVSLHGIYARGFPNLFIIGGGRQAAVSINIPFIFGEQARHFAEIVKLALDKDIETIEVSEDAEQRWAETIRLKSKFNEDYTRECTPSYFNNEGKIDKWALFATAYGGGPIEYAQLLVDWRRDSFFDDMDVTFHEAAGRIESKIRS